MNYIFNQECNSRNDTGRRTIPSFAMCRAVANRLNELTKVVKITKIK